MSNEESVGATRHMAGSTVSVTVAAIVLAVKMQTKPWEDKAKYPTLYPAYSHRITEGYDVR